jgi:hypothetical protein
MLKHVVVRGSAATRAGGNYDDGALRILGTNVVTHDE